MHEETIGSLFGLFGTAIGKFIKGIPFLILSLVVSIIIFIILGFVIVFAAGFMGVFIDNVLPHPIIALLSLLLAILSLIISYSIFTLYFMICACVASSKGDIIQDFSNFFTIVNDRLLKCSWIVVINYLIILLSPLAIVPILLVVTGVMYIFQSSSDTMALNIFWAIPASLLIMIFMYYRMSLMSLVAIYNKQKSTRQCYVDSMNIMSGIKLSTFFVDIVTMLFFLISIFALAYFDDVSISELKSVDKSNYEEKLNLWLSLFSLFYLTSYLSIRQIFYSLIYLKRRPGAQQTEVKERDLPKRSESW
jgi:hypothetical protein